MATQESKIPSSETRVSVEEVNRVLEVGRLLLSVLTPDELEELHGLLYGEANTDYFYDDCPIGNTSVT